MNKSKRLLALFLTVYFVLSMAVPAVFAEEEPAEKATLTYDFGVFGTTVSAPGNSLVFKEEATNTALYEKLMASYEKKDLHWYFAQEYAFSHAYGATATMAGNGLGYSQARMMADGYIAFTIRNPGQGAWEVSVTYPQTNLGAQVAVYILPGGTTALNIPNALTEENCLGVYDCLDTSETAIQNPTATSARQTLSLKNYTFGTEETYKLVLKSLNGEKNAKSMVYISSVDLVATEAVEEAPVVNYDFDFIHSGLKYGTNSLTAYELVSYLDTYYKQGKLNWNYKDLSFNTVWTAPFATFSGKGYFFGRALKDDYVAFTIDTPGTGNWQVTLDHPLCKFGAKMDIYILPGSVTALNIKNALTDENRIGRVDCMDSSDTAVEQPAKENNITTEVGYWTAGDEDTYTLVFRCVNGVKSESVYNMGFAQLNMIGMGDNEIPEKKPIVDDDVEIPDISPDIPEALLKPEIAVEDAVASVQCVGSATSVVNGHDYIYLLFNGGIMLVYDLDTGELIDKKSDVFNTPRWMCEDKDGIIWVCGASTYLYRYDPIAKTGEQIKMPDGLFPNDLSFNALGITSDENGMIYFGTYNRGYLGMYDPVKKEYSNLGGWLDHTPDDGKGPDAQYSGFGGIVVHEGYAYLGIDGDKNSDGITTHQIIKFDLAQKKIVDSVDVSYAVTPLNYQYMYYLSLVDDLLICSTFASHAVIDINTMELVTIPSLDEVSIKADVSNEIDGKVYFTGSVGNKGLYELDIETREVTYTGMEYLASLRCYTGGVVTIDGLPGTSLVTHRSDTGSDVCNIIFYNPATGKTLKLDDYTKGLGSGNQLRAPAISPDGETVFVGAYQSNKVGVYDVSEDKIQKWIRTAGDQVDGLYWYDGYLYVGNYNAGTMTQVNVETNEVRPLFMLHNTAFDQVRMHNFTAGDGKVFVATVPYSNRYGGDLVWFDIETDRVYVAAGPNPEDVYYTKAWAASDELTNNHVWYSAKTGELVDFDDDKDGVDADDSLITENGMLVQRFTGVIENQCINCIVYKDGYIYGSTTRSNGSGALDVDQNNAILFVYDVAQMKVVATYDVCEAVEHLTTPVPIIDVITEDPVVPGKFWGVVSDTLFSFTYSAETGFSVTEELALGKHAYSYSGNAWNSRSILFDGDYMYVSFGSWGIFMIEKANPENYLRLSEEVPKAMVLAADGNLYYTDNTTDLMVLPIAETAQAIKDPSEAADVQAMIDKLSGTVTLEDEAAILAARAAYDALSEAGKALVTNLNVLTAAEASLAALKDPDTNPKTGDRIPAAAFAGILIVSAAALSAVWVSDIRRKRV